MISIKKLKQLRNDLQLSQTEMAEKIGVSISYYSKIEGDFKEPSYQFLKKLKASFGSKVDMNNFFE
ncbi:helix-turn-helix domain-containing protein [Oceanobacillus sp. FSL K6-0251]|uniref:helix-turn-helix domain-containing protein n=1 Tax=Oceanobacillus sp. FSL K6-0251 TaxID=2921602 RepID=UPI004046EF64